MLGNNKISFNLIINPEGKNRTKHINVMHHHIECLIKKGELGIK